MYPKIRNPFFVWFLTVFTSGLYAVYWVSAVCREINFAEEREIFEVKNWGYLLIALVLIAVVSLIMMASGSNPILLLMLYFVGFFSLFVKIQVSIGTYIQSKYYQFEADSDYSSILSAFLFWFIFNTGIAYTQIHINQVINSERSST